MKNGKQSLFEGVPDLSGRPVICWSKPRAPLRNVFFCQKGKSMKLPVCFLLVIWCSTMALPAATTRVDWFNSAGTELRNFDGELLSEGLVPDAYDGDVVQLGYYSLATTGDPFLGQWMPLQSWTIGDKDVAPLGPGRFNYSHPLTASQLLVGIPLSIRFYDSSSLDEAGFFNAVSDVSGSWNVISSPDAMLTMTLSLASQNLVWQDGQGSAFRTTIPVPEPGGQVLWCCAGLFLLMRRKPRNGRG